MPKPELVKARAFGSPKELGRWLEGHHATDSELWVKVYKKGSGVPSVSWSEIVLESLCWGWIDGVKKSLDEHAYLQRITPRRAGSGWSKKNTEHVERLIVGGRMQEAGLAQVRAAKADGRWEKAYAPASEMQVPDDFLAALAKKPKARRIFDTLTKSSRYVIAYGLATAKKPETRERRSQKFMDLLLRGETPNFGFKKGKSG